MMRILIGAVVGGALIWGALQYHLVRTNEGFTYVPKQHTTLADTYIDVRQWGVTDWAQHPDLALSLSQNGHKDLIGNPEVLEATLKDTLHIK